MLLIGPPEDHAPAVAYADELSAQPNARATWEQIYLGARAELALARTIGAACLARCLEHLARPPTPDDYRFDLAVERIDVKACEPGNGNLIVNRVHRDVRYALLRARRLAVRGEAPSELRFDFVGWSPGEAGRFEPHRSDPRRSFQHASKLLSSASLFDLLLSEARSR